MKIPKEDLNLAAKKSKSYKEFKKTLKDMGHDIPMNVKKFPHGMKGWGRKLRYEMKENQMIPKPMTGYDRRQAEYYKRLERLGCPDPIYVM